MASTHHVIGPAPAGAQGPAWEGVAEQLLALVRMLEANGGRPSNLVAFAEGYADLGRAYCHAIDSEGRSSMRAESVVRALDLRTPKSDLLRFLGREAGAAER